MISLYHAPMSSCTQKVRFVLEQKGLEWEKIAVDLHSGENLTPEFLKLNPKGVIPVLIDGDDVYVESNNICIYLDEQYPDISLMPSTPKGRSDVRTLIQHIDEYVHTDSSALTYAIAFGPRLRATYDTPEKLATYLDSIPDAGKRNFRKNMITLGTDSIEFGVAVKRLRSVLKRLDGLLQENEYLVGSELSIADIVFSPYMTRLEHLSFNILWEDMPKVTAWFERVKGAKGYQQGVLAYVNDEVKEKMNKGGSANVDKVRDILAL